jgi:hypothetical protein
MTKREIRIESFADCLDEKPLLELPIMVEFLSDGELEIDRIHDWVKVNYPECVWKNARRMLFGGYYYCPPAENRESFALLIT